MKAADHRKALSVTSSLHSHQANFPTHKSPVSSSYFSLSSLPSTTVVVPPTVTTTSPTGQISRIPFSQPSGTSSRWWPTPPRASSRSCLRAFEPRPYGHRPRRRRRPSFASKTSGRRRATTPAGTSKSAGCFDIPVPAGDEKSKRGGGGRVGRTSAGFFCRRLCLVLPSKTLSWVRLFEGWGAVLPCHFCFRELEASG